MIFVDIDISAHIVIINLLYPQKIIFFHDLIMIYSKNAIVSTFKIFELFANLHSNIKCDLSIQ